ncbi:MAG TPA: hypothetical protein VH834_24165 [Solirubrobacteraceae bacterium]
MHEATRVRSVEGSRQLGHERNGAIGRQRSIALQQRPQIRPLHVAHRDVQPALGLAGLEDRHDPRVVDRRRQPRLGQESLAKALVIGQLRRQELQRHPPPEPQILSAVDGAHTAAPDQRLQPVATQLRPDRRTSARGHSEDPFLGTEPTIDRSDRAIQP